MLQLDEISLEERYPVLLQMLNAGKHGPLGRGEIIIAPKAYIESVLTLPQWGYSPNLKLSNEQSKLTEIEDDWFLSVGYELLCEFWIMRQDICFGNTPRGSAQAVFIRHQSE